MSSPNVTGVHHLVGVHEIAAMLEVSRQRVHQLAAEDGFPAPEVVLHGGKRVWHREAIEKWAAGRNT